MQLLHGWTLNVLATALIVSSTIALLGTIAVRFRHSAHHNFWSTFLAILSFAMLGFVTGDIMGDSREASAGTIVTAVLTLLGGVAVYVIGSKGIESQIAVGAMVFCFSTALLMGTLFGVQLRIEVEDDVSDPMRLRWRDLAVEQNRYVVEIQRLEDYMRMLKYKREFAEQEKLDLSHFKTSYEAEPSPSK